MHNETHHIEMIRDDLARLAAENEALPDQMKRHKAMMELHHAQAQRHKKCAERLTKQGAHESASFHEAEADYHSGQLGLHHAEHRRCHLHIKRNLRAISKKVAVCHGIQRLNLAADSAVMH